MSLGGIFFRNNRKDKAKQYKSNLPRLQNKNNTEFKVIGLQYILARVKINHVFCNSNWFRF